APALSTSHVMLKPVNHHLPLPIRFIGYLLTPLIFIPLLDLMRHTRQKRRSARAENHRQRREQHGGPAFDRRLFMITVGEGMVFGSATMLAAYSTWYEPWMLKVRRYEMPIKGLPASMDGFTLVQLSDT